MSTRSIIVFKNKYSDAHIYVHSDGYPSNRLVELQKFLEWNEPRNGHVSYAAANFVLWYKLVLIRDMNDYFKKAHDERNVITTLDYMLTPHERGSVIHLGIGVIDDKWDDYEYKYVVDFDAKTIRVTGHERDATVEFGQVVEFNDEDEIIEAQIPAN